jgi:hypothetical protein
MQSHLLLKLVNFNLFVRVLTWNIRSVFRLCHMPHLVIAVVNMYAGVDVFSFLFLDLRYHVSCFSVGLAKKCFGNFVHTKKSDSQKFLLLKAEKTIL